MKECRSCGKPHPIKEGQPELIITKGLCASCRSRIADAGPARNEKKAIDSIDAPVLLMQPNPRQVYVANNKAEIIFGKDLPGMEGHRGGEVFDCIHSFTEAGCGKDVNCADCKIKNAVVETFTGARNLSGVSTTLEVKKRGEIISYVLEVSTEKVGELALLRIDRYERR